MTDGEFAPNEFDDTNQQDEHEKLLRDARRESLAKLTSYELDILEAKAIAEQQRLFMNDPGTMLSGTGNVEPEDMQHMAQLNEELAEIEFARIQRLADE